MRKLLKNYLCILVIFFSIVLFSSNVYAKELIIDGNQAIYTNEEYGYSTKLPVEGIIFYNNAVYCDGEELDSSGEELAPVFNSMEAFGALFIYSDYDFEYEISCSVMPCEFNYDWDEFCKKIANGEITASDMYSEGADDVVQAKWGDYLNDSTNDLLADYYDNVTISTEIINDYRYMVSKYQGTAPNAYIIQYVTTIGNKEFFFKFVQHSGNPSNESLTRFNQIIKSSSLPPKPERSLNTATSIYGNEKLTDNIIVRLSIFLVILAIIYGLRFLISRSGKKDGSVLWNPTIDYTEVPFSNPSSLREHILNNPYNLSFLNRSDALNVAKSQKPFLSFGCLIMWIIGVMLPVVESIITANWWILLFIPLGVLIPIYSRHLIKSWTQIIPIAVATIYSNPVVFYLCVDFVIIRSLYDLWYCCVLKTAGKVICEDDSLFSKGWNDSALAVMVNGEPYFHKKVVQNDKPITTTSTLINDVKENDKFSRFKKSRAMDANTLYAGVKQVSDMFFSHTELYPNGENDVDKSKIVGLCAYLIAGWTTSADPKTASEVCRLYGNDFQLYNQPVSYANEMLNIANDTYREIRSVTDNMEKTTTSVKSIVNAQASCFVSIASIPLSDENVKAIEEVIFFFINQ